MIHPLLHLIATKPQLLGDHVEAYAELVGAEVGKTSKVWMSRLVLYAAAMLLLTTFIIFTGVALMLCAMVPSETMHAPWLLVAVPLAPLIAGVVCLLGARARPEQPAFDMVKQQFNADLAMLREVSAGT